MRYSFLRAFVVVMTSFFLAGSAYAQPVVPTNEHIAAFFADIAAREDGTILVAERIEYVFPTQRHGIYRDLPIRYSIDGRTVRMPVEVLGVERAGAPTPFTIENNGNVVRVKIGDPDATITGAQSYVVKYTVQGALRYFEDHDELYWNVTGNGWEVPIKRASALVRTPPGSVGSLTHTCYTGPKGSTAQECLSRAEGETVSVVAEDTLTIVVGWKPGLVAKVLPVRDDWYSFGKTWPYVLPFLAAFLLYRRWSKTGRDPKGRGTDMVQYDPPGGLSPAETGCLIDERAGAPEIVATIVGLAVRGHVKFVEVMNGAKDDIRIDLIKGEPYPADMKPYERSVLETLFGTSHSVLVSDIKEKYVFDGKTEIIAGQIDEALVAAGYFPKNIRKTRGSYLGSGLLFIAFIGFPLMLISAQAGVLAGVNLGISLCIVGAMFIAVSKAMVSHTEKGVLGREHAVGFKEYLEKAEKYRLQWQEKEGIFEKFLPYAMVFGVADKWTKAFEGFDLKKPDWYEGRSLSGSQFNAALLMGSLSHMEKATSSAVMATKPSESSSGSGFSGGSSGGGGGGGGGGSW